MLYEKLKIRDMIKIKGYENLFEIVKDSNIQNPKGTWIN